MSFNQFRMAILSRVPHDAAIKFYDEGNRYVAISEGIRFLGNGGTKAITVKWGSGHQAQFGIA